MLMGYDIVRYEKFTEQAKKVLSLAEAEARRFQHASVGTEHLLLGLLREGEGVAAKVLANLSVTLDKVHSAVEFILGYGDRIVLGSIGADPHAKKAIAFAIDEANRSSQPIGTEHLLLGLVRENEYQVAVCQRSLLSALRRPSCIENAFLVGNLVEGIGAGVLESFGVSLSKVRLQTIEILNQQAFEARRATESQQINADETQE